VSQGLQRVRENCGNQTGATRRLHERLVEPGNGWVESCRATFNYYAVPGQTSRRFRPSAGNSATLAGALPASQSAASYAVEAFR